MSAGPKFGTDLDTLFEEINSLPATRISSLEYLRLSIKMTSLLKNAKSTQPHQE